MKNLKDILNKSEKIKIENSTVDFYNYKSNNENIYFFDTSECATPEPMLNAMIGLQLIKHNDKLIMLNHTAPIGLFPRIQKDFNYTIEELEDNRYEIVFTLKKEKAKYTNFKDIDCPGV